MIFEVQSLLELLGAYGFEMFGTLADFITQQPWILVQSQENQYLDFSQCKSRFVVLAPQSELML